MDEELDSPHANFEFGARLHRAVVRAAAPGGLLDTLGTLRFAPLGEIALYVAAACGATAAASVSLRAKRGNRFLLAAVFLAWCGVTMGLVRELRAFSAPTHARGTRAWAIEVLAARAQSGVLNYAGVSIIAAVICGVIGMDQARDRWGDSAPE